MQIGSRLIELVVNADGTPLPGRLTVPEDCRGVVVFAHGSGSSRLSPRNLAVAATLNQKGCATLLFDLLTEPEAADRGNVFDIALLGRRMVEATNWLEHRDEVSKAPVGFFGASTGSAAALVAAAELRDGVAAVVSRGGRPDLANDALPAVTAPTLLIVGSQDHQVLELNRSARAHMRAITQLLIVQGATHLFEEPGTLDQVAEAAGAWFQCHFDARRSAQCTSAGSSGS